MSGRDNDQSGTSYVGAHDAAEAERLVGQEAGALEELRSALALHSPAPRARVLELGCGSGVFTRALLAALPDTTITATDYDERLLAAAREALAPELAAGRVTLLRADAARLPFAARSFDLVACRCLLMHQQEPLVVVSEMFRVANTGGVALAIEPDWGARALYPDGEALGELLAIARQARPFGFPDLLLGRTLYALFRAAGFVGVRVVPTAFAETAAAVPPGADTMQIGPARLLEQARERIRRSGAADDAAIDALIARFAALARHPEYFSAGMDFAASGMKPEPALGDMPR